MTRRRYTRTQRIRIFDEAGGICWRCGVKIHAERGEQWHLGHVDIAHAFGGKEVAPEHISCNREDAKQVKRLAAKSDRIRARHLGIKRKPKGNPMAGTKASGWKQKIGGAWERRT